MSLFNKNFDILYFKTKFRTCNLCHIFFKRLYQHINSISFLAIGTYFRYYLSWDRWTSRQGNGLTNQQKYLYFFFLGSILWFLPFNHWRSTSWLGSSEKVDISIFDFISITFTIFQTKGRWRDIQCRFSFYFFCIILWGRKSWKGF